ncbi:DUF2141 domain-containing protein [Robiginitalea marina]|uniref:DUF2141 domain-containing protein n=1 Tax=Robiginitalea marina TaxID=2954105 RepID=A0ABT1B198_9FLAO|nr:DUF2141 domain-containing protein [Robiginitalea marina]MCO5725363.1 DUF2141 domain-containing protein [Robiginitalea marina]
MKSPFYLLFFLAGLTYGQAPADEGVTVTIILENVLNDQGEILAGLHTSETFMKGGGIASYRGAAEKGVLTFQFPNVSQGVYAVSILHDLNGNERMDFQPGGMPSEPYAMSGNDMSMGPPSFESARFTVGTEDVSLRIRF